MPSLRRLVIGRVSFASDFFVLNRWLGQQAVTGILNIMQKLLEQ